MSRIAVITGGSGGIGRAAALALSERGCTVYELSRSGTDFSGVRHITADVSDEASLKKAADAIIAAEGRIDILLCNAGFGISGAVEFTETEEAERLLDVNFFGVVRAVHAFLPFLRASRGRIVVTSSIAGILSIPFQAYYSVSKAAINSYTSALANELRPFGVTVCAVMPGDIHTGFTDSREKQFRGDDIYSGRISRSVARMEKDERSGMRPEAAGGFLASVALRRRVKPLYAIGLQYKVFSVIYRLMPCSLVNFILGKMYAN